MKVFDERKCVDFLTSPFALMFVVTLTFTFEFAAGFTLVFVLGREGGFAAVMTGRKRSLALVLRIRSKNGTEPFFGRPCTCVVNAGCD